jgi:release factor glutamine methyltransferase
VSQTAKELLKWGVEQLSPILFDDAVTDARVLLSHAMGIERGMLTVKLQDEVTAKEITGFHESIRKRINRQPVAQIIGYREFWGRKFKIAPDVLDPRPDSETLIEDALEKAQIKKILDIGTGSGCILLTLLSEWPNASGVGVDISIDALKIAEQNAQNFGIEALFNQTGLIRLMENLILSLATHLISLKRL